MRIVISLNYDYCAKHDAYVNPRFGCHACRAALQPIITDCPRGCGKRVRWLRGHGTGPITGALVDVATNESHDVCCDPPFRTPEGAHE